VEDNPSEAISGGSLNDYYKNTRLFIFLNDLDSGLRKKNIRAFASAHYIFIVILYQTVQSTNRTESLVFINHVDLTSTVYNKSSYVSIL